MLACIEYIFQVFFLIHCFHFYLALSVNPLACMTESNPHSLCPNCNVSGTTSHH